jgi:hypothetical protein
MNKYLLPFSSVALSLTAVACSTGSDHPTRTDAGVGTGGKSSVNSGTGGSAGTDAGNTLPACGVYKTGASDTYETATLHGQAWTNINPESNMDIYNAAGGSQICARGTVVNPSGNYGWAILMLDVNTVLQPVTAGDADAGADAGTALSAWNSLIPQTSGLIVNVNNKAQTDLWVCLQSANYHQWCVQNWTNSELIRWTDFIDQDGSGVAFAMQPLMTIQLTVPGGSGSFDFCINSVVEAAAWCACPGGNCTCPAGNNPCNGTCVPDTSVNPLNCGTCGKVCPNTSACHDGECGAPLYDDLAAPSSVAIDGNDLFFTEAGAGTVMKGAIGGGAAVPIATSQNRPIRVVTNSGNVYWANAGTEANSYSDGSIMKLGVPPPLATGQNNIAALAVDSKYVYWANNGTQKSSSTDGSIMKADPASGNVVTLAKDRAHPRAIALDASNIYWVEQGSSDWGVPAPDGNVMKLALDAPDAATSPQILASSLPAPMAIAVDANNVYYAAADSVFKISLSDGKTTTKLASGQSQPYTLLADATDLYWTNLRSGAVTTVPIAGGTNSVILARALSYAYGLALDSTNIYWVMRTSTGVGGLLKMPK